MFIRLNLLRHYSKASSKWPNNTTEINSFRTQLTFIRRYCSDIKRNEELLFSNHGVGVVIPSPLKIKQTIKTGFYDFVDGPICIQTSCPTCPSTNESNAPAPSGKFAENLKRDEKHLFINKTTGKLNELMPCSEPLIYQFATAIFR